MSARGPDEFRPSASLVSNAVEATISMCVQQKRALSYARQQAFFAPAFCYAKYRIFFSRTRARAQVSTPFLYS